jgi:hypothetical protein
MVNHTHPVSLQHYPRIQRQPELPCPIGTGDIEATVPLIYSGDETLDIGSDIGTPVSDQYPPLGNEFTGKVRWVQMEAGDENADHLVHPEDRLRIIMARQ